LLDHVQIGQRRLDHDQVGPFGQIEFDFAQSFAGSSRKIHLITAAVAELWGALSRVAERPVKGTRVLGGVAHDRHMRIAGLIEGAADGAHHAVHHGAGGDDVGAGASVADRLPAQQIERGIVVDIDAAGVLAQHTAVAVVHVLAEANVGDHQQIRGHLLGQLDRALHDPFVADRFFTSGVLVRRYAEQQDSAQAVIGQAAQLLLEHVERKLKLPGHRRDRVPHVHARADKERKNKIAGVEVRILHQAADQRVVAQPAHPRGGKASMRNDLGRLPRIGRGHNDSVPAKRRCVMRNCRAKRPCRRAARHGNA
jgi:hypothetical protein